MRERGQRLDNGFYELQNFTEFRRNIRLKNVVFLIAVPPELVPINFGKDIFDEGTLAQLLCTVSAGDEPLTITWSFHGNNISSDSGIMTSKLGTKTQFLMIQSVSHGHRGMYTCMAKNNAGTATSVAELKVNG